jgi:hypothetical protein
MCKENFELVLFIVNLNLYGIYGNTKYYFELVESYCKIGSKHNQMNHLRGGNYFKLSFCIFEKS